MVFFPSGISGLRRDLVAVIYDLFLAAGKIGKEGCGVNPVTGICNIVGSYDVGACRRFRPGYDRVETGNSVTSLLSSASSNLKALFVADHDEEIIRYADRIKGLEFVAYVGAYANGFTDLAHVVIPAASYAEADGTYTNTERRIQLNRKKIEPPAGVRPAWRVYADIAARRGFAWPCASAEDVMAAIAAEVPAYSAVTYAKLEKSFGLQWPCDARHPDGCARLDLESLPRKLRFVGFEASFGAPKASEEFPFLLIPGKANTYWHKNAIMKKTHIPKREYNALLLQYPLGYAEIAAADAAKIGVRDGRPVTVTSAGGTLRMAVKISADVKSGSVYVPYFVQDNTKFLSLPDAGVERGEDSPIPVRIEKA